MDQTPDQIERHIDEQREEFGANMGELQHRVKRAFNWRAQFQQRPVAMIAVAFGGGIVLSRVFAGISRSRSEQGRWQMPSTRGKSDRWSETGPGSGMEYQKKRAWDTWDTIKGAFIGIAATKFKNLVSETIPGFEEHYRKTEREKSSETSAQRFRAGSTQTGGERTGTTG
jgi:hypothetical protein